MANRILGVLFKKKYANGDTDTIYPKTRAQDVTTSGGSTLETIATKVNGIAAGATKVEDSSTNGNILVNGSQVTVYSHPNSGATAGTYNKVTVNAQGHVTSGSNVTDWTGTVSGNVSNGTVTSTQASSRSNLASGEKLSVSMGKIRKWFADLKSLAFVDKVGTSNLDSTLTTFYNKRVTTDKVTQSTSITEAGWVADARVIRTLQNQINTLNSNVSNKIGIDSAATHNAFYRGKDITTSWNNGTAQQAIANGTFEDIYPGDYIIKTKIIDGVTYTDHIDIIVECDPYYGKWNGSNGYVTTHHVGIIPYQHLGKSYMNSENITTGGFYNSYMYNTTLPKYLTGYKNAYGSSHILSFGHLISDVTKDDITAPGCGNWKGGSIDWSWYTTQITLMSEVHVYGSRIWGGGYDQGEACSQLAAFKHNAQLIHFQNGAFWLRAVTSSTTFAHASSNGYATTSNASYVYFVRPLVLIF